MPAPLPPINLTLKMPPTPHDWVPLINIVATVVLGIVVVWLNYRNARRLEGLKADIGRDMIEHQTRFSKLHAKRAEVIAELYGYLRQAEHAFWQVEASIRNGDNRPFTEIYRPLVEAMSSLQPSFRCNRIYLDESLCVQIDDFQEIIRCNWMPVLNQSLEPTSQRELVEQLQPLVEAVRRDTEAEFRAILGVSHEAK